MSDTPQILDSIQIKEPCSASWEKMSGDERARHCRACSLTVFNFSSMTREAAEKLVREKEGRLCARFYRRADGTILTADCGQVIKQKKRRRTAIGLAAAASLFAVAFGATSNRADSDHDSGNGASPIVQRMVAPLRGVPVIGSVVNRIFPMPIITMGKMVMGDICAPTPAPLPAANATAPAGPPTTGVTMGEVSPPGANEEDVMGRLAPQKIVAPVSQDLPVS